MNVWAVVVAAGRGTRYGTPKQYLDLGGQPLWQWSRDTLANHPKITDVVLVGDMPGAIAGGVRRRDSVYAGLRGVPADADWVLVHDGVRPVLTTDLLDRLFTAIDSTDAVGVIPALPVTDTIKSIAGARITGTVDRSSLVSVQTPQAFRRDILVDAHERTVDADVTDDAALVEQLGGMVVTVPGDPHNIKVTFAGDLELAEHYLERIRS